MQREDTGGIGGTDVAALSASCVAAAITIILDRTAYDLFDFVISATLVLVVVGTLSKTKKPFRHHAAISAVIALSLLPATGLFFELVCSSDRIADVLRGGDEPSKVDAVKQGVAWFACFIVALATCCFLESRKPQTTSP